MTIVTILASKVIVATAIAIFAEIVRRRTPRPEPAYAVWATVLAVLLIPAVVTIPVPEQLAAKADSLATRWVGTTGMADEDRADTKGTTILPWLGRLGGELQECWLEVFVLIWLLCGALICYRQVQGLGLLERLLRFAAPAPASVSQRCAAIARDLRIRECPAVVTAGGVFSPFLWHPMIGPARVVIPSTLLEQFSDDLTDAVLRHELIHLRRQDAWRRRLELLVLALWWWLPTTWIARNRLRELEELCTDAEVLRSHPDGAKSYACALLDTEEFLSRSCPANLSVVPAFMRRGSLPTRITRIVAETPQAMESGSGMQMISAVMVLLSLGLLTAGIAPGESSESSARRRSARVPAGWFATQGSRYQESGQSVRATLVGRGRGSSHVEALVGSGLPDFNSVTVLDSDREIILTWTSESATAASKPPKSVAAGSGTELGARATRTIRLVRISPDGVQPRLWRIVTQDLRGATDRSFSKRELEWLFAFLHSNNAIIDRNGKTHSHPGLVRLSDLQQEEHETCGESIAG